jgi:acyl dehydratase
MTETMDFASTPDLRRLFATSIFRRHPSVGPGALLPSVVARQDGIRVDTDRLIRYARVCGFSVGEALPLTYPHVLGFPLQVAIMARSDFPFALLGLVHVENTITWTRPLTPGDTLDIEVRPDGPQGHRRGQVFDLLTDVRAGGEPVWRGVTTYLARGKGAEPAAAAAQPPPVDDLGEGTVTVDVPGDIGRRYAGVSGDPNPIHMYGVTARLFGFKTAIAHGMWSYARVLAALGPAVGAAGTSRVWFRQPVPVGRETRLAVSPDGRVAVLRPASGQGEHLITALSD